MNSKTNVAFVAAWWGLFSLAALGRCDVVISTPQNGPRLVLDPGGPVGTIRALEFAHDSSRVYSGGQDKVVNSWTFDVASRSIVRTAVKRTLLTQTLRWEIARGPRGIIYALAASPAGPALAIAGYGARSATGDIVVYDTATGQVARALRGHRQTVVALAYSPDGNRLASVDIFGELRVWSAPDWNSQVLIQRTQHQSNPRPLLFLGNDLLVGSHRGDDGDWRIRFFDLTGALARERDSSPVHPGGVTGLAIDRGSGRWASADRQGGIYLWNGTRSDQSPSVLRQGRVVYDMDFAPDGRLYVATALFAYPDGSKQAVLECWDVSARRLADQVETSSTDNNYVCAVSPDGRRVVTYDGDSNQLLSFDLTEGEGTPLAKPLSSGRPARLRGRGQKIWKVAFADDGSYRIGFGTQPKQAVAFNDYAAIGRAFDLSNPTLLSLDNPPARDLRWKNPESTGGGWSYRRQAGGMRVDILRDGQPWSTVSLNPTAYGRCRSLCWLNRDDGQPYAVAIGTDVQNGVFVFGLGARGGACPLLRYFRDHTDFVTSLGVSRDGRYLVSGSVDQTINIWSLEGLQDAPGAFSQSRGWGATFEMKDGEVVLTSVLEAGTAGRKGLRPGDVVVDAEFGSRDVAVRFGKDGFLYETNVPREILTGLEVCPLYDNVVLRIRRRGRQLNERILLVPAWTPMTTLFADRTGEWALWTPQGYYDASIEGDTLFGWQLNRGVDARPDYFGAEQFRDSLERPEVMRRLLSARSLPAALRQASVDVPANPDGVVATEIQRTPIISILKPLDGEGYGAQDRIEVVARVEYPDARSAALATVRAFVNGVPNNAVAVADQGVARTFTWNVAPPDAFNRLRVTSIESEATPIGISPSVFFRSQRPMEKPKLHVLAIAAADYPGELKLDFPVIDATSFLEMLQKNSEDFYELGEVVEIYGHKIDRESVDAAVARLTGRLAATNSSDLLVVFVAGHGFGFDREYYFAPPQLNIPPQDELSRLPAAQQQQIVRDELERVGISWRQFRQLADIPCRKVFLLDTCFSGNILLAEPTFAPWKSSIRPLQQNDILVVSATSLNQLAFEDPQAGHGVFTKYLLEGLGGRADDGQDGNVDLEEISDYIRAEVPKFTRSYELEQTPTTSPRELLELISVPLVNYPD